MSRISPFAIGLALVAVAAEPPAVPKDLLAQRLEAAQTVYRLNLARVKEVQASPADLIGWSGRWLDAELALADKPADRTKALRAHVERTREVEQLTRALLKAGQAKPADAAAATYDRADAEIRLAREGGSRPAKEGPATDRK